MAFGFPCRDKLLAYTYRKRQIGESIAMEVAQFAASDTEFDASEPVGRNRHARPTGNRLLDLLAKRFGHATRI